MERDEARRRGVGLVIGVLVGILIAAVISGAVVAGQIRNTQLDRLPQSEKNDQTLSIVKDCTQVGGKCYERGQRQIVGVLTSAQRIIILSAACSVDVNQSQTVDQRIAAITACVTARLTAPPSKP